jgi:hypothetical protein
MLKKVLLATAVILGLVVSANAMDSCIGTIHKASEWTTVAGSGMTGGTFSPEACKFRTNSAVGRKILRVCPDQSQCSIDLWKVTGGDVYGNGTIIEESHYPTRLK